MGLITTNHDIKDPSKHVDGQDIVLGEKCWIGMNAVILPGVILGPGTVVGAGAVVTNSFPQGRCVLGGVPAKLIKDIILYLVLTFFALFTLIPFMWMVFSAFKSTAEIQDTTVAQGLFPKEWTFNLSIFFIDEKFYIFKK